jgi:hypothetical protein
MINAAEMASAWNSGWPVRAPEVDGELIRSAPGPLDFGILHVQANQIAHR